MAAEGSIDFLQNVDNNKVLDKTENDKVGHVGSHIFESKDLSKGDFTLKAMHLPSFQSLNNNLENFEFMNCSDAFDNNDENFEFENSGSPVFGRRQANVVNIMKSKLNDDNEQKQCSVCNYFFPNEASLKNHMKTKHKTFLNTPQAPESKSTGIVLSQSKLLRNNSKSKAIAFNNNISFAMPTVDNIYSVTIQKFKPSVRISTTNTG